MADATATLRARDPRGGPPAAAVDRSPGAIAPHLEDAAHFPGGRADGIARPRTEADVADLVVAAPSVLAIGAQSSVTGGATPAGGLILSTERLSAIAEDGADHVRAGAGVPLVTLQAALADRGQWFPPVPTFNGAFVGGVAATNAAGAATYKDGATRAWMDGLTVVLPAGTCSTSHAARRTAARTGSTWSARTAPDGSGPAATGCPTVPKCSAGYFAAPDMDVIDLFIGAEGTLGIIVEARLRVLPAPPAVALALVPVRTEATALSLVADLRQASQTHLADGRSARRGRRRHRVARPPLSRDPSRGRRGPAPRHRAAGRNRGRPARPARAAGGHQRRARLRGDCRGARPRRPGDRTRPSLPPARPARRPRRHRDGDARRRPPRCAAAGVPRRRPRRRQPAHRRRQADGGRPHREDCCRHDRAFRPVRRDDGALPRRLPAPRARLRDRGHISDGNVHPNAIPRSYDEVVAAKDAVLEFGARGRPLGGSPLAEHGVGRSAARNRPCCGRSTATPRFDEMRAVKRALDPDWKLAPGVLFDPG